MFIVFIVAIGLKGEQPIELIISLNKHENKKQPKKSVNREILKVSVQKLE